MKFWKFREKYQSVKKIGGTGKFDDLIAETKFESAQRPIKMRETPNYSYSVVCVNCGADMPEEYTSTFMGKCCNCAERILNSKISMFRSGLLKYLLIAVVYCVLNIILLNINGNDYNFFSVIWIGLCLLAIENIYYYFKKYFYALDLNHLIILYLGFEAFTLLCVIFSNVSLLALLFNIVYLCVPVTFLVFLVLNIKYFKTKKADLIKFRQDTILFKARIQRDQENKNKTEHKSLSFASKMEGDRVTADQYTMESCKQDYSADVNLLDKGIPDIKIDKAEYEKYAKNSLSDGKCHFDNKSTNMLDDDVILADVDDIQKM